MLHAWKNLETAEYCRRLFAGEKLPPIDGKVSSDQVADFLVELIDPPTKH